jgi:hypothetical protein
VPKQCDELRPQCKRCSTYGVLCNFQSNCTTDFHSVTEKQLLQETWTARGVTGEAPRPPVSNGLWTADGHTSFAIDEEGRDLLSIFKSQAIYSQNDSAWTGLKDSLVQLAFTVSFALFAAIK